VLHAVIALRRASRFGRQELVFWGTHIPRVRVCTTAIHLIVAAPLAMQSAASDPSPPPLLFTHGCCRRYVFTNPTWKNKVSPAYRSVILKLLEQSKRIKKAEITKCCTTAGLPAIPNSVYQKVVHELGVNTGGQWSLKSGNG
jgi:hypothetical protein